MAECVCFLIYLVVYFIYMGLSRVFGIYQKNINERAFNISREPARKILKTTFGNDVGNEIMKFYG